MLSMAYLQKENGKQKNRKAKVKVQRSRKNVVTMEAIAEGEVAVVAGEGEVMDVETTHYIKRRRVTRVR